MRTYDDTMHSRCENRFPSARVSMRDRCTCIHSHESGFCKSGPPGACRESLELQYRNAVQESKADFEYNTLTFHVPSSISRLDTEVAKLVPEVSS